MWRTVGYGLRPNPPYKLREAATPPLPHDTPLVRERAEA
jgi:hypothetical protein